MVLTDLRQWHDSHQVLSEANLIAGPQERAVAELRWTESATGKKGAAHVVIAMRNGQIASMKDHRTRRGARRAAGLAPAG